MDGDTDDKKFYNKFFDPFKIIQLITYLKL